MAKTKKKIKPFVVPVPSVANRDIVNAGISDPNIDIKRVQFDIYTYKKFKTRSIAQDEWYLMDATNDFLASFDKDERYTLTKMFASIKRDCDSIYRASDIFGRINNISTKLAKVFHRLDLINRAIAFAQENERITFVALKNQGKRPQDDPVLTWHEDKYRELAGLSVVFKLMFPVFGEIIKRISIVEDNTNEGKEIYAASIMEKAVIEAAPALYEKLLAFIANTVAKKIDKDAIAAMYGITAASINKRCMAIALIKNLVNFDLYDTRNLLTYIHVSIGAASKTNFNKKATTHYSDWATLKHDDEDDSNSSLLDETVALFVDQAEKRPLIVDAMYRFIARYIHTNRLREDIIEEAYNHYTTVRLPLPTKFNETLLGLFISKEMGSAYCMRYINNELFVKLVIIVQLYMARMGYADLIPMLSLEETKETRPIEVITNSIMIDRGHGSAYSYLKAELDHLNKFINVANYLDTFADYIVSTEFIYNVPASIESLTKLNKPSKKGYWRYDKDILAKMFGFIYQMLISEDRGITNG